MSVSKSPSIPSLEPLSPLGPPDPSIPKAAEMIGVSERTMRRAVERGEIEAYKLLGNTRVKLASLHLFVQRARSVPLKLLPLTSPGKRPRGRPKRQDYAAPAQAEGRKP
jgi:excisionase family DNA binding protein